MKKLAFDLNFEPNHGQAIEVSPLLRRVTCDNPGPFTFKGTNTFIVGRGRVAIIDPGPDDAEHLGSLLNEVRHETVSHIIVTHTHMDHSPLAVKLKLATGALVCGAELKPKGNGGFRLDASIDHGFKPDAILADGDEIDGGNWRLQCVTTPGHLGNHMAFSLAEEKSLLVGDHVMAWATSIVAPPDGHMGDYMDSLRKLLKRDDDVFHPAHGPLARNPKKLVEAILAHRIAREEMVLARAKAGDRSLADMVKAIYVGLDPALHAAAELSTWAHLEHLAERGLLPPEAVKLKHRDAGQSE
jgi:glyoxylase-like metal-dependent hydrolase (beta-lactamase superfamily II)